MNAAAIVAVFESTFDNVRLEGGADEPFYSPAAAGEPAIIRFREDFAASALHEVAHWCIAGPRRRALPDFGYWYEPVRDGATQSRFEAAEAEPQALEWILSVAAGRPFRVSFDNFDLPACRVDAFRCRVRSAAQDRLARGLPARARRFAAALSARSGCVTYLDSMHYQDVPR